MAAKAFRKSVEQLKMERSMANWQFSRLVNSITRTYRDMSEEELKDSFNKLTVEAEKVMEANDGVEAGLMAEAYPTEAVLTEQQNADLANTANECELKLNKVKKLLQETLWTNSGSWEVSTALRAAESGIIHAAAAQPCGEEACEFILNHLQGLVKTANEIYGQWQRWMPPEVQERVEFSLSRLELGIPQLIHQKVDFIPAAIPPNDHVPTMKLKPTAVPKCSGNRFDLQCWGKDCEAPKRQNKSNTNHAGCVVCGSMQHKKKLFFCKHFRALKLTEKEAAVSKLGACEKCLEVHDDGPYSCKPNFICNNQDCKDEHTPDHHYCLCPKAELKKSNWVQKKVRFHRKEPHCCARYHWKCNPTILPNNKQHC